MGKDFYSDSRQPKIKVSGTTDFDWRSRGTWLCDYRGTPNLHIRCSQCGAYIPKKYYSASAAYYSGRPCY